MKYNFNALEQRIMQVLWAQDSLSSKQIHRLLTEPPVAFPTLSFALRMLENKSFIKHIKVGNSYFYSCILSQDDYLTVMLHDFIGVYFNNDPKALISTMKKSGLMNH